MKYKVVYEPSDIAFSGKLNYRITDKDFKIRKIQLPDLISTNQKIDTIHTSKNNILRDQPNQLIENTELDSTIYKVENPIIENNKNNIHTPYINIHCMFFSEEF